jgi:biopolymer transport protein ExbB
MIKHRTKTALAGAACALFCAALWAQDGSAAGEKVKGKTLLELFEATGIVGYLLAGCSLIGTTLLIQFLMSMKESKLASYQNLEEIEGLLAQGRVDEAKTTIESDRSYLGRVLLGALERHEGGFEEVRKGLEETSAVEAFRLNARISLLSLIGNIGPLLGLLGTVTGMISSFQVIESMKAPTPGDLAKGVYESLVNTTIGLFIAIVFLSAYFFMKNKVSDITLRINNHISEVLTRTMAQAAGHGGHLGG